MVLKRLLVCLSATLFISASASAQTDAALNKLLHEDYGPEDIVIGKISGSEAFITVKTRGFVGMTSQSCKLSALTLARKVMSISGKVNVTHVKFYGDAKDSYREVTVDASQLADFGSLLDSMEVAWHGTKPRINPKSHSAPGDKWCNAGDIKFRVPPGWLFFPHPQQDSADTHQTVLAKVRYKPQNVGEVVVRVHDVVHLKKQHAFALQYFKEVGFHVLSSGPAKNTSNLNEAHEITVQRKVPGKYYDDWEKHIFFEAGGRVYSLVLYTSSASSQEMMEQFQTMLDSLQWEDHPAK